MKFDFAWNWRGFVTALNEKGIPTPLAATMLRAPQSRMDILVDSEIEAINAKSKLVKNMPKKSTEKVLTKF